MEMLQALAELRELSKTTDLLRQETMPEYRPIPRTSKSSAADDDELTWTRQPCEVITLGEWCDVVDQPNTVIRGIKVDFSDNHFKLGQVAMRGVPTRDEIARVTRHAITKLRAWHYIDHHAA